jgi:hypothetical protein
MIEAEDCKFQAVGDSELFIDVGEVMLRICY